MRDAQLNLNLLFLFSWGHLGEKQKQPNHCSYCSIIISSEDIAESPLAMLVLCNCSAGLKLSSRLKHFCWLSQFWVHVKWYCHLLQLYCTLFRQVQKSTCYNANLIQWMPFILPAKHQHVSIFIWTCNRNKTFHLNHCCVWSHKTQ